MKKIHNLLVYLNLWRIFPAYFIFKANHFKTKCDMDYMQWKLYLTDAIQTHTNIFQFGYIMLYEKSCRNIFLNRLHRNPFMYIIVRILFPPLESCYINMPPEKLVEAFLSSMDFLQSFLQTKLELIVEFISKLPSDIREHAPLLSEMM